MHLAGARSESRAHEQRAQWEWAPGRLRWALRCPSSLRGHATNGRELGPLPAARQPRLSGARTARRSNEGGAYTLVGGRGGVCAGSPIWGRQVWCAELLWRYVVGFSFFFPLGSGESIPFLSKFPFLCLYESCAASTPKGRAARDIAFYDEFHLSPLPHSAFLLPALSVL